ncbi:hypothetical protein GCM10022254_22620 [Actinomadura meridiana]|uniref:non-specific serine/threonine protein kinase n=2 Tax=Actinomadura meridiana TaxID=559626 RepID=A0ABP8BXI7_9ACTN
MGEVWAADDMELRRRVAVKVVLVGQGAAALMSDRLRREAENAARLQHPGITVVHDIGEQDGQPFFVMELLNGTDFATILAQHPHGLAVGRVLDVGAAVADGLGCAHRRGVLHRDIKPANLMELAEGGVKICDFGISRSMDATGQLTAAGGMMATPAYTAPEQYEGRPADARSDLYAFGCTLYALLAGVPPFVGDTLPALMRQHLMVDPLPPSRGRPGYPPELDQLVLWLLAKDPARRPGSADEVAQRFRALAGAAARPQVPVPQFAQPVPAAQAGPPAGGGPAPAPPMAPPVGGTMPPPARRGVGRRAFLVGGLVLVGGAAAAGAVYVTTDVFRGSDATVLSGHTDEVNSVVFSPDGRTLATGSLDGNVRLWDVAAERSVAVLDDYPDAVEAVAYSPDGKLLAAGGAGGTVQFWDTGSRRGAGALKRDAHQIRALAFSQRGGLLASGGDVGAPAHGLGASAELWNLAKRRVVGEVGNPTWPAESVAFSPDGTILATAGGRVPLVLWDVAAGRRIVELEGHGDGTLAVAFSPDGKTLATGHVDNKVRLWKLT